MKKHHPKNERMKRDYFSFLEHAKRQNVASVDAVAKALNRFEVYTGFRDFKTFHVEQAKGFKKYLAQQVNQQTGKKLSKATLNSTVRNLKEFFEWLAQQRGYKSRLNYTDAEYFNLSEKDVRVATARREKPVPTVQQIKHVIDNMPSNTDIERRNRSLIAFTLLTGARGGAIVSLKLKHVNLITGSVFQDAREVETKGSKTFTTYFCPVDVEIRKIFYDWVTYLINDLHWGNDDPVFPQTNVIQGDTKTFKASGLKRAHWSNAAPIRKIFREAFAAVEFQNFNPHSFRNTLVMLGEKLCQNPEEFKAWSQNIGHSGVLTTFFSYGEVQPRRQAEIIKELGLPRKLTNQKVEKLLTVIAHEMGVQKED